MPAFLAPQGATPSGTVTFLFSDIEGSTKLWETSPEAMRVSVARHDSLMRQAIAASDGYVFKTIGDAFCAAFSTASKALEAVLAAQRALQSEPWPEEAPIKVRMALHTGAVESRDNDYFGLPVNRVARLLSTAHGGQSVLSQTTFDLVRDSMPVGASAKPLGEHRLKDLGRAESIFQLLHPSLTDDFPPLRSLDNPDLKHNLPRQVTSFVGRVRETGEVRALLEQTSLLTLTGAGGSGKTRLSLQVAADMLDGSGDGVWLVELAPLTDPGLVPSTVASVLGLKEEPGKPILQTLTEHLKSKDLLLLLDNCEHLLDACATLADTILRQCPQVLILATSREGLGIAGELTYRIPSLSLPDPRQPQTPESLVHYEAVRLFVERARFQQPRFAVTNQNAPALASICRRLDGIPLAIELAAARVRSLTVEDINSKLDQRFRLLTGGSRTALPRQQTLRSLIDWSYDLLNEAEKALLIRLSVFQGGWSLEAAETVCTGEPVEAWETLDLLTSLCDKSLVVSETTGQSVRYRMLETVRQYARDRLLEHADWEAWRDSHLAHFLALAEEAEPQLIGPQQQEWLDRLEAEHDNLRAALEWSMGQQSTDTALRLCPSLGRYWLTRGYFDEGREWCDRALSKTEGMLRTTPGATVLYWAGGMAYYQGDYASARSCLSECLAISRETGSGRYTALSLNGLALVDACEGDYVSAQRYLHECLEIAREVGDPTNLAQVLNNLGNNAKDLGEYALAKTYLQECVVISREIGYRQNTASALYNLGGVSYYLNDYASAKGYFCDCLKIAQEIGYKLLIAESLESISVLVMLQKRLKCACNLWGAAEILRESIGAPIPPDDRLKHEEPLDLLRADLGVKAYTEAWSEGRAMTLEQAIALALEAPDT